jgi:hypothetical protein
MTTRPTLSLLNSKTATLALENRDITLARPHHFVTRSTGLLNHISLPENDGILFTRTHILHTFGMRFPILVLGFNKRLQPVFPAKLVEPNTFFVMSLSCRYVAEISSQCRLPVAPKPIPPASRLWVLVAKLIGLPS